MAITGPFESQGKGKLPKLDINAKIEGAGQNINAGLISTGEKGFVKDGKLTAEGIAELRTRLPHADIDKLAADPRVEKIGDLFTVQMIINFLNRKLAS